MALHPASIKAAKILKNKGFDFIRIGALEFKIFGTDYNKLFIKIICSSHNNNLAKFEPVCWLYNESVNYKKLTELNDKEFNY